MQVAERSLRGCLPPRGPHAGSASTCGMCRLRASTGGPGRTLQNRPTRARARKGHCHRDCMEARGEGRSRALLLLCPFSRHQTT